MKNLQSYQSGLLPIWIGVGQWSYDAPSSNALLTKAATFLKARRDDPYELQVCIANRACDTTKLMSDALIVETPRIELWQIDFDNFENERSPDEENPDVDTPRIQAIVFASHANAYAIAAEAMHFHDQNLIEAWILANDSSNSPDALYNRFVKKRGIQFYIDAGFVKLFKETREFQVKIELYGLFLKSGARRDLEFESRAERSATQAVLGYPEVRDYVRRNIRELYGRPYDVINGFAIVDEMAHTMEASIRGSSPR